MLSSSNKSFPCLYYEVTLLVGVQIDPTKQGTCLPVSTKAKHKHPCDPAIVMPSSLSRNMCRCVDVQQKICTRSNCIKQGKKIITIVQESGNVTGEQAFLRVVSRFLVSRTEN